MQKMSSRVKGRIRDWNIQPAHLERKHKFKRLQKNQNKYLHTTSKKKKTTPRRKKLSIRQTPDLPKFSSVNFFSHHQPTKMKRAESNPASLIDSSCEVGKEGPDWRAGVTRPAACHIQFCQGEITGTGASHLPSTPSEFPAHNRRVYSRLAVQPADTDMLSGHNDEDRINRAAQRFHSRISDGTTIEEIHQNGR